MIKLHKRDCPQILVDNAKAWEQALMTYINNGTAYKDVPDNVKNKYNNADVKDALLKEANHKCMYCESDINEAAYYHIEHYRPKSKYPSQSFCWDNLGLSCQICNGNKSNTFDEGNPFVNPYKDDPDEFFAFCSTMVMSLAGNKRAHLSESVLKLNRPELIEKRSERLKAIRGLAELYAQEQDPLFKSIYRKQLEEEISETKPYSRCMKSALCEITKEQW